MRSFNGLNIGDTVQFRYRQGTASRSTYLVEGKGVIKYFDHADWAKKEGKTHLKPHYAMVESEGELLRLVPRDIVEPTTWID